MSFQKPINGDLIQRFGADFQKADGSWYYKDMGYLGHNGDDYAAPIGTPVYAADDGTVKYEGWGHNGAAGFAGWMGDAAGICVLIDNGGLYSGYAHLNDTVVNAGDTVTKGQLIGHSGATGAATGPHLHFEAIPLRPNFQNGYAGRIDPSQFMDNTPVNATADEIQQAYQTILERPADDAGLAHYEGYPIDFVRSDLASSQEYRDLQARKAAAAAQPEPAPVVEPTPAPVVEPTPAPVVEPTPAPVVSPVVQEPAPVPETPVTDTPMPIEVTQPTSEPVAVPVATPAAPTVSKLDAARNFATTVLSFSVVKGYLKNTFDPHKGVGRTVRTWLQAAFGIVGFMLLVVSDPSFKDFWLSQPLLTGWAAPATAVAIVSGIWNAIGWAINYLNTLGD